jgi:hypothetical protein
MLWSNRVAGWKAVCARPWGVSRWIFCQRDSTNEQIKNAAVPIQISTTALFSPGADLLFILLPRHFWP